LSCFVAKFHFWRTSPYDINNFDVIVGNTFLDAYKVDILHNEGRLKVHAKSGFKLMNLCADYNFALVKMGVNLVTLVSELKSLNCLILMFLRISQAKPKPTKGKTTLYLYFGFS
jgi:hypothetical protein